MSHPIQETINIEMARSMASYARLQQRSAVERCGDWESVLTEASNVSWVYSLTHLLTWGLS